MCVCRYEPHCTPISLPPPLQAGKLFDELDADGSGTLTKSELGLMGSVKGVWSRFKKSPSSMEDNGGSGASSPRKAKKSPTAKELFDMLDGDHDGSLTREEV